MVADDPLAQAGLAALLSDQPGCVVVGHVAGNADLPTHLETFRPNVVFWDLGWDTTAPLERLADLSSVTIGEGSMSTVAHQLNR